MTARAKADTRWIADFRSRYAAWWPGAAPLIEQHDYASAFKSYPWPAFTETPWTPFTKPLAASRIPTISLSNNPGATRRVMPPRWAHARFPRGSMLGEPGNRDMQLAVLRAALAALGSITTPGGHIELPYRWETSPVMWRGKPLHEGSNS